MSKDFLDEPETEGGPLDRALARADHGMRRLREKGEQWLPGWLIRRWRAFLRGFNRSLPKGLLGRSLLIILVPMVVLLIVLTYAFMQRHWETVTARLSSAVVRDIAFLHALTAVEGGAAIQDARLIALAGSWMRLQVSLDPPEVLPPPPVLGFTDSLIEHTLTDEIENRIGVPFSLDVDQESRLITVKLAHPRGTLTVRFARNLAYAANWHIFILWMMGSALLLAALSILFIRNQIKPIQRLARAAEAFGRGAHVPHFSPQGAQEVRKAAEAFLTMRERIERQIEQRTIMLAGVSHDLRTLITRLRLELALMPESGEAEAMRRDLDEMEAMLEAYLAFAKGDAEEEAREVDLARLVADIVEGARRAGTQIDQDFHGAKTACLRVGGFKRLLGNLLANAVRHGTKVQVSIRHEDETVHIVVDDNGPGIEPAAREAVFRPFYRLDAARNQNEGGSGLGLAIARDIARSHGGDVTLEESPLGGVRARVRLQL